MTETFKYVRLEISSVIFRSWEDFLSLLRRKNSQIEKEYFAFLYCGKNFIRRKKEIPACINKYKCSYFVYSEYDVWLFFNQCNKKSNKFDFSISKKISFVEKLKEINARFNATPDPNDYWRYSREVEPKTPFKRVSILQLSIPMITLNAAIVEGALREIMARYIQNEINKYIEEGNATGRTQHNNYQKILVAKQIKIESNSSYGSIMDEYSVIFGLKPTDLFRKEIILILESLFTLRNLFAHGTSIVTTNVPVEHDPYFKNWNNRVVKMQEVLKKYFGSESIHENISDYRLAEFYMSFSRMYLLKIAKFIGSYDESGYQAIEGVNIIKELKRQTNLSYRYNDNFLDLYNFPKS